MHRKIAPLHGNSVLGIITLQAMPERGHIPSILSSYVANKEQFIGACYELPIL